MRERYHKKPLRKKEEKPEGYSIGGEHEKSTLFSYFIN
jgi:hypothetical protein